MLLFHCFLFIFLFFLFVVYHPLPGRNGFTFATKGGWKHRYSNIWLNFFPSFLNSMKILDATKRKKMQNQFFFYILLDKKGLFFK